MTDYYVANAPTGDDGATGLIGFPWETVSQVSGFTFSPGDTISFNRDDTFDCNTGGDGGLSVLASGTKGNPITYGAYGTGAKPILDGASNVACIRCWNDMSYITVQDFTCTNGTYAVSFNGDDATMRYGFIISRVDVTGGTGTGQFGTAGTAGKVINHLLYE